MNTMANFCRMQSLARKALVQTKHFYVMSAALSIMHLLNLNDRLLFPFFLILSFIITMYFNLIYPFSRLVLLIYLLLFLFLFFLSSQITTLFPHFYSSLDKTNHQHFSHTTIRISSQKIMSSLCPLNVTFLLLLTPALPFFVFIFILRCLPIYSTIAYLYTHINIQL